MLVLTEAEEEGVHAHAVHAEEPVGNEVGAHDHRLEETPCTDAAASTEPRAPARSSRRRRKVLNPTFPRGRRRSEQGRTVQSSPSGDKRPQPPLDGGQSGQHRWARRQQQPTKGSLHRRPGKHPQQRRSLRRRAWAGVCVGQLCPLLPKSPQRERAAHQNRDPVVIQRRRRVLDQLYPLGEEEEGEDSWESKGWTWLWDGWARWKRGRKGAASREG